MKAEQIPFPFRVKQSKRSDHQSAELVGRSYIDGNATIKVIGVCLDDDKRVMVERDLDGRIWSMPAWLMRLIFLETKEKRAA